MHCMVKISRPSGQRFLSRRFLFCPVLLWRRWALPCRRRPGRFLWPFCFWACPQGSWGGLWKNMARRKAVFCPWPSSAQECSVRRWLFLHAGLSFRYLWHKGTQRHPRPRTYRLGCGRCRGAHHCSLVLGTHP